jgi:MFS family permease
MDKNSLLLGLTRNIIIVGFVSLFTDLSSQMVFPLIPLFLTSVLGAGAWLVGLVEGVAETTASLLKVFSGYWSDKIKKRKPFILTGYGLSTIAKPLFAFASSGIFVLLIRVSERIGKGIRNAPRDAIIAESTDESVRGKAYGFHRAMDGVGSIFGAIIALILLPILGFRNIFLFAFIPGAIAVFLVLFIKEKNKSDKHATKQDISIKISLKKLPRNLKLFIFVSSIFAIGHFGYAFLLLKVQNIGLSDNTAILFYVFFYIIYTIFVIPSGILSDKIGRKPIIIGGYILFAITSIGLMLSNSFNSVLFFFIVYGIFYAMIDGVQRAFVVDLAPSELKATALGTFHTAIGLVALPGGFIAGLIWDTISPEGTFLYALILTLLSLFLFIFVKNNKEFRI